MKMKAFVTGSTGLLGSNLVNILLAQGYQVKALARSEQKARKLLKDPRIEIVVGDMEDIDGFKAELKGVDVLFHVAAYFREYYDVGDHWTKLQKINIDGTIKLLQEAEKAGVKKAIYVSSSGVIGNNPDGTPGDENTPPGEFAMQNLYFKSKVIAEEKIAEFLKTHTLPVVLILPTVMIGPQDAAPTVFGQVIINLMSRKLPMIPPGGMEFVDARDVAQAMVNAVERGKSGERYIVSGGFHSMSELAKAVEKASGVPAPRLNAPYAVMLLMARLAETTARITNTSSQLTVSGIQSLVSVRPHSNAKAKRELHATFRPFEESIRDEVNWYRENGYVGERV
jgi:dihydroflavonol-4-reductase